MIGQTISHYEILEKLGEGGMGIVYKAHDTTLDRLVALKFLPSHLSTSEQDKARFIQEARAAAALNHPNVCSIFEIQDYDDPAIAVKQMFIVMEFVDGQTLREKKSSISFKQAIDIGIQVADGLAAAHEKGIVHRDIKPENIMIRKDGIAQIMDFGLAKLRGNVTRLTREGSTIGTAGYMSPEQVQGQDTDYRSDIFSYGVMLYELFTGGLPFKGVHETALLYEIVNVDASPMSAIKPEIDPALDAIILECLEKDPNERAQSIKQVSIDLKRFRRESTRQRVTRTISTQRFSTPEMKPLPAVASPKKQIPGWVWTTVTSMLFTALLLVVIKPWNRTSVVDRPPMHFTIDLPLNAAHVGGSDAIAISPDGRYLAYTGGVQNNPRIYLRKMNDTTVESIPGTDGGDEPVFSPDGQWIAFVIGEKLKKVSIFGGAPEDICATQGLSRGLWWDPDTYIYFGHISRGLQRVSSNGGIPEPVTTLDTTAGEISHRFPQLLPDGKSVIFTIKPNNITSFDDAIIAAQRLGASGKKILVRGGTYARYISTGHLVYVRGNSIYAAPFDVNKLEVTGPPAQIADGGWMNGGSGQAELGFSNTGAFIYTPAGSLSFNSTRLAWMDRQGKLYPLLDTLRSYAAATLSPDGQKLAININAANDDIWIYHLTRGTLTRLTFGGGNNDLAIWSPDGRYVMYQSEKGRSPNIFRKLWDGSGGEERLTTSPNAQIPTSCSPDGKLLAFSESGDIWILPLDNERKPWPFIQSPAIEGNAVFSPDGRWVAYNSNESGKFEVYVVPFPRRDGKWQVSNGGGFAPLWSGSGRELLFSNGAALMAVDISPDASFDYSVPRKLCDMPASVAGVFDAARDGQRFVVEVALTQQISMSRINIDLEWFTELNEKFSSAKN